MKLKLLTIAGMLMAGAAFADGPTLPDQASDKAVNALSTIAFGKKGAEARAAHAAENQAADRAAEARAAAAARAAEASTAAATRAADARAAAGATRVVPTPTSHPGR